MIRLIGAEFLKLRTTRTFWALTGSALGLVLLIVVLTLAIEDALGAEHDVIDLLATIGLCGLVTLVLGAVVGGGEYRHGTVAWTLLVTPDRVRAVAAQVLACALAGLAISLGVAATTAAIALPWLAAKDAAMPAGGDLVQVFLGVTLYAALAAAFGAALGALLRSQVAAVVIVLVQILVVEPTLAAVIDDFGPFTLAGLGAAMSGVEGDGELLPPGVAALLWALYALLVAVLAVLRTARRDV